MQYASSPSGHISANTQGKGAGRMIMSCSPAQVDDTSSYDDDWQQEGGANDDDDENTCGQVNQSINQSAPAARCAGNQSTRQTCQGLFYT